MLERFGRKMLKAVILAAGKGTRMKSDLPKVVHEILGKPLVYYAMKAAKEAGAEEICVVVGYGADLVQEKVKQAAEELKLKVDFALQREQLGTGHAVRCAKEFIGEEGQTMILFGDTPLITGRTLKELLEFHKEKQNGITVLSTVVENPSGYGRIVRKNGAFVKSVEDKDATPEEKEIQEINSGMYLFESKLLYETLDLIKNHNAQREYYLPDTLTIVKNLETGTVDAMKTGNYEEILGVNTLEQLKSVEEILRARG